jgi:aryl-alcohol dehydrogenase-like predicted oxidoreductase
MQIARQERTAGLRSGSRPMIFGDEWGWGSPKAKAQKAYETYREAGGNFIDTANFYTNGAERTIRGGVH